MTPASHEGAPALRRLLDVVLRRLDLPEVLWVSSRLGLTSTRERSAARRDVAGGTTPGAGTTVTCVVPTGR